MSLKGISSDFGKPKLKDFRGSMSSNLQVLIFYDAFLTPIPPPITFKASQRDPRSKGLRTCMQSIHSTPALCACLSLFIFPVSFRTPSPPPQLSKLLSVICAVRVRVLVCNPHTPHRLYAHVCRCLYFTSKNQL